MVKIPSVYCSAIRKHVMCCLLQSTNFAWLNSNFIVGSYPTGSLVDNHLVAGKHLPDCWLVCVSISGENDIPCCLLFANMFRTLSGQYTKCCS